MRSYLVITRSQKSQENNHSTLGILEMKSVLQPSHCLLLLNMGIPSSCTAPNTNALSSSQLQTLPPLYSLSIESAPFLHIFLTKLLLLKRFPFFLTHLVYLKKKKTVKNANRKVRRGNWMFLALGNVSHLLEMLLLKLVVRSTTSPPKSVSLVVPSNKTSLSFAKQKYHSCLIMKWTQHTHWCCLWPHG